MTIWLPGADYFTISKINGLGLRNVEKPLQCIYLLPPPLQTCCSHFDQLTTNLLLVNPSQKMNKGTPVRFKLEHRDVVLKRAEWLIFLNEPTRFGFRSLAILLQLNDRERLCNRGGGTLSMMCLAECSECITRNSFYDTHETHVSLWLTAYSRMWLHIKTTGAFKR
jgi:hypothetical protein